MIDDQIGYIYIDDVTGLPAEEPAPEAEESEEIAEEEAEEEDPEADMKVTIFSSRRTLMTEGEDVYLTSKLEGFDGFETYLQWECDKGEGFQDVEGANEDTYVFSASVESLSWNWRLTVYYKK